MDDNAKNAASYHLDQEVLDARGIGMTVEEVAGLPTAKYSQRVHALRLRDEDLAFLKGLRRRIKNRLASQNSRRRSMEQLRRLTRELRAVRACRADALADRATLTRQRDDALERCRRLRDHLVQTLRDRLDTTAVPEIDIEITEITESQSQQIPKERDTPPLTPDSDVERDKTIFECRIEKLVQKSVNHIFNSNDKKKIFAKTVFLPDDKEYSVKDSTVKRSNGNLESSIVKLQSSKIKFSKDVKFSTANVKSESADVKFASADIKFGSADVKFASADAKFPRADVKFASADVKFETDVKLECEDVGYHSSDVKSMVLDGGFNGVLCDGTGVLNLSVKEGRRKSHGRKQSAPRRITYVDYETPDGVLDLKVKK